MIEQEHEGYAKLSLRNIEQIVPKSFTCILKKIITLWNEVWSWGVTVTFFLIVLPAHHSLRQHSFFDDYFIPN